MLATIIATVIFMSLVVAAMAVGVIFSNKPIKGSCGGIANLGMKGECEICGGDSSKCDEQVEADNKARAASLGYDARRNMKA